MKICSKCKIEKEESEFYSSLLKKKAAKCKECIHGYYQENKINIAKYKTKYWQENKEKLYEYKKEWRKNYLNTLKICDIHNIEYYTEECPACSGFRNKKYKQEHQEEIKEYAKFYAIQNRHQININYKKRRENDPIYNIRRIISSSVYNMIKNQGSTKNGSIIKKLPYSIQELKIHLELQFEPWMNWNNHGKYNSETWNDQDQLTWTWQIDHIIPQSDLPYTSMEDNNFKKCWDLSNLRPYSAKQNVLDGILKIRHLKRG